MSSSLPASRLSRRLLKLASLGLAGLLAGLLTGCTYTSDDASTATPQTTYTWGSNATETDLPASIEARQAPALRHPSTRFEYVASAPLAQSIARPLAQSVTVSLLRHP